jgi:hypothetical protein
MIIEKMMEMYRINREIAQVEEFKSDGSSFSAIYSAERYLKSSGYAIGSMCCNEPIGFAPADKVRYIAKWRNISKEEYHKLSGILVSEDFRDGDKVYIILFI